MDDTIPSAEELANALKLHRSAIVEANEWRPLAQHVHALIGNAMAEGGRSRAEIRILVRFLKELVSDLDSKPDHTEWNFTSPSGNVLNCKRVTGQNYDSIDFEYNPGD